MIDFWGVVAWILFGYMSGSFWIGLIAGIIVTQLHNIRRRSI